MHRMRPEDMKRMQWVETAACVAPPRKQVLFYSEMTDRYVIGLFGDAGEILEPAESAELKLTYCPPYHCSCLLATLLAACVSSKAGLDPSLTEEIPKDANVIRVHSDEAAADLYRTLYQTLAAKGYEIKESNAEMRTVSTEFNEVGQETLLPVRALA